MVWFLGCGVWGAGCGLPGLEDILPPQGATPNSPGSCGCTELCNALTGGVGIKVPRLFLDPPAAEPWDHYCPVPSPPPRGGSTGSPGPGDPGGWREGRASRSPAPGPSPGFWAPSLTLWHPPQAMPAGPYRRHTPPLCSRSLSPAHSCDHPGDPAVSSSPAGPGGRCQGWGPEGRRADPCGGG